MSKKTPNNPSEQLSESDLKGRLTQVFGEGLWDRLDSLGPVSLRRQIYGYSAVSILRGEAQRIIEETPGKIRKIQETTTTAVDKINEHTHQLDACMNDCMNDIRAREAELKEVSIASILSEFEVLQLTYQIHLQEVLKGLLDERKIRKSDIKRTKNEFDSFLDDWKLNMELLLRNRIAHKRSQKPKMSAWQQSLEITLKNYRPDFQAMATDIIEGARQNSIMNESNPLIQAEEKLEALGIDVDISAEELELLLENERRETERWVKLARVLEDFELRPDKQVAPEHESESVSEETPKKRWFGLRPRRPRLEERRGFRKWHSATPRRRP